MAPDITPNAMVQGIQEEDPDWIEAFHQMYRDHKRLMHKLPIFIDTKQHFIPGVDIAWIPVAESNRFVPGCPAVTISMPFWNPTRGMWIPSDHEYQDDFIGWFSSDKSALAFLDVVVQ